MNLEVVRMPDREITNKIDEIIAMRDCFGNIYSQRPLVRCKDCVHFCDDKYLTECFMHNGLSPDGSWFCADGERRS